MVRLAVSLLLAASLFAAGSAAQSPDSDLRARMYGLLGTLTQLTGLVEESRFADPADRETVEQLLGLMAADAGQIARHAEPYRGEGFRRLAGSLAEDAERAMARYDSGDAASSRRLVRGLADVCFACHSTLPGTMGAGASLEPDVTEALPPAERMRWAVVAREFEAAMELGEEALLTPARTPREIVDSGAVADYLLLAIRVRGDLRTPRAVLAVFRDRKEVSGDLRDDVEAWIATLSELEPLAYERPKLGAARDLLAEAPAGRRGLVHVITASALLHQFVWSEPEDRGAAAEAYFLLGTAENTIRGTGASPAAGVYLETSIRLAPGEPVARDAFALFERIVAHDPGRQVRLGELRTLAFGE